MRIVVRWLLVVICLAVAAPVFAQPANPWHNAIVADPEGRLWVIVGTTRYPISPKPITAAELAQFAEGSAVATRNEICELPETAAVAPPATPPPGDPVKAMVGQSIGACREGIPLAVQVVSADAAKTLNGRQANGQWVSVVINVTNNGRSTSSAYQALGLRDERGRTWRDVAGTGAANQINYQQLATQAGAELATRIIGPGQSARVLLIFDAAADVGSLELYSLDGRC